MPHTGVPGWGWQVPHYTRHRVNATNTEKILILAVGGTFDKVYYDALSDYRIGDPQAARILKQAGIAFDYEIEALVGKDSLDMDDDDRRQIRERLETAPHRRVVVTHGTDTMAETAQALATPDAAAGKTVVLTGAMQPARFRETDADFNLGFALGAALALDPGVYLAMNGRIFKPGEAVKNRGAGRFEKADPAR